jgi:hypothetical protein
MSSFGYTSETAPPGLRDAYKTLEADPNADYGTILPFAIDRASGKPRWAMPSGLDLLAGLDTGEVTSRAALQLGFGGLGFGAGMVPRGAHAMGGARPFRLDTDPLTGLKLDPASRFERARSRESTPRILPLLARSEKPVPLTLSHGDRWGDFKRTIADAFAGSHDAVAVQNYRMFPELGPQTIWGFRDPSQLRSRFAVFDPVRRDSSDLMAGFAAPLLPVPVPGFNARPEPGLAERAAWLRRMNEDGSWQ